MGQMGYILNGDINSHNFKYVKLKTPDKFIFQQFLISQEIKQVDDH